MRVNKYNFLRWDDGLADTTLLPNFYVRSESKYMPVLVPGEELSFYINTKDGLSYPNPETFTLKIVRDGYESAAIPVSIDNLTSTYNIYASFVIPLLNDGVYVLQISNGSTVLLTSNYVRVMNSGYEKTTSYVKFRNSLNLFGVRYGILTSFYQKFRIHLTETDPSYEYEMDSYTSSTTGKVRSSYSTAQQVHGLQTYFFDKDAHEAAAAMSTHSTIQVNGVSYGLKTGYKPDPVGLNGRSKGVLELYDLDFVQINKCNTENRPISINYKLTEWQPIFIDADIEIVNSRTGSQSIFFAGTGSISAEAGDSLIVYGHVPGAWPAGANVKLKVTKNYVVVFDQSSTVQETLSYNIGEVVGGDVILIEVSSFVV